VKVELQGFQTVVREGIRVSVGDTTTVELGMRVASLAETVTVKGESPVIDTTSANVNVHLDAKLLETTPSGRDIWSLVEYKVPGIAMAAPDVGGNQGGLQRGLEARGTPNSQNTQMLNGVNVGDPAAIGFAGYYYDPSSFEDIQVSTGAQDISVPAGGVFINMVTKSGTNRFTGSGLFTYQSDETQADNITPELRATGIRPNANAVDFITNFNLNSGGPILKNKLFYFASLNDQRTHVNVTGFPAITTFPQESENTDITALFLTSTYQMTTNHRLQGTATRQVYDKPNRGANAFNTPESTWHEHDVFYVFQGLWNWVMSNNMFVDTRLSYNKIDFPLFVKTDQQTLLDRTTSIRTRSNSVQQVMGRERLQVSSNWQYFIPEWLGGRHEIRAGIDNAYTPDTVDIFRNDQLELRYSSTDSGPTDLEVRLFNSPLSVKRAVMMTSLYAQDSFSYKRLTVTGGIRWERVEGWVPAQSSPPSPWFPEGTVLPTVVGGQPFDYVVTRDFDELRDIPLWKNVGPRLNVVYDVTGRGKTVVKASAARYNQIIGTGTPGGLNPNGTIQERYVWNDKNGDMIFQDGEQGALTFRSVPATFDTLALTRDPNLKRPHFNEWTVGIDHELIPNLRLSTTWTNRQEHDPITDVELNVPFSAYTPVTVNDPGRDGVAGTSDDSPLTVYNENLPLQTHITRQQNDNRVATHYKGIEVSAQKRFSNNWMLLAGYTWGRAEADMLNVTTPNDALVNASGKTGNGRVHIFKLTGSYLLPHEIQLGGNFRLESGPYITRTLDVRGLNQGTITVNAEPRGSVTLDKLPTLDLRVGKIFHFGIHQMEVDMDIYNVTNSNTVYDVRRETGVISVNDSGDPNGQVRDIARFGSPIGVLGPRVVRFNVSYRFGS
ncbi:MAG TPA: TonB-dependent receptor plug domain-containing protein, partial [Vicinamibacterales bacterium]|nr:TonB-dependent receptor plug domain-containing protein [Vicinamibacterales bacterium]